MWSSLALETLTLTTAKAQVLLLPLKFSFCGTLQGSEEGCSKQSQEFRTTIKGMQSKDIGEAVHCMQSGGECTVNLHELHSKFLQAG